MFDAGAIVGRIKLDTSDFDGVVRHVENRVSSLGQSMQKAGQQLNLVSRQISIVGRNLTFFGAGVVTPMIVAFKYAEKYSNSVRIEMERLTNVSIQMRTSVAEALVPAIHKFSNVLADLLQRWNNLSPALRESIVQTTFMAGLWTMMSGLALSLVAKIGQLVAQVWRFSGALVSLAAANIPLVLTVATLAGISYAMIKINGLAPTLNWFETTALRIAAGWTMVARAMWDTLGVLLRIQDPFGSWSKSLQTFTQEAHNALTVQLDGINKKLNSLANGNNGVMANFVDDMKEKINTIKGLFANLGTTEFNIPDKIFEASKSFAEGWEDAIKEVNNSLRDWGSMAKSIVDQTTQTMQSSISTLLQDVKTGFSNAQDFFVDWGNFVIKIIADVIAQLITAKIVGAAMGMFSGAISGLTANVSGKIVPVAPPNYYLGHADGIERVPYTGLYKLHTDEEVVPKYDAGKDRSSMLTIYNLLTSEAIAAGMASKEGQSVIVNVVNENSLRNGVIRREVKTR